MWKRLGQVKNKRQVKSILLVWVIIAVNMIVMFPLTAPKVKAQVTHLATASEEDAIGMPYDTGPKGDGVVVWDKNVDHIISNPAGYTVDFFMTLDIPAMNYVNDGIDDPDEHEITLNGNSIEVYGRLLTHGGGFMSLPGTAFIGGGLVGCDGIYFHPGSEGCISGCLFKNAHNAVVFEPGSKLIHPGIYFSTFIDMLDNGLQMDGASGYTNMEGCKFQDTNRGATGLSIENMDFYMMTTNFNFHGNYTPQLHIKNGYVYLYECRFSSNFYVSNGPLIFIEGNSKNPVFDRCKFVFWDLRDYFIRVDGSDPLFDNCTFDTEKGQLSLIANDDSAGVPAHPIIRNPTADYNPGYWDGTFDNSTINATGSSSVILQWYLDVCVRDPLGNPMDITPVYVKDRNGNPAEPPSKATNVSGWVNWFIVTELIEYQNTVDNFNPFNVSADVFPMIGYVIPEPMMNMSKEVYITVPFNPNNILPIVSSLSTPLGVQTGDIIIQFELFDPDPSDNGNLSVEVYWSLTGSPGDWSRATSDTSSDPTTKLLNNTLYNFVWDSKGSKDIPNIYSTTVYIMIVPYDRIGAGTPSKTMNFTVDNKAPGILSGPVVTATNTTALIEWTADEPANASVGYGLYIDGRLSDITDEKTGSTMSTSQSVKLTGLEPGRNYTFVIISTDMYGNWIFSPVYSFETEIHIQLYKGWNMISIPPLTPDPNHGIQPMVSNVLASVAGQYDAVQAYIASDPSDPWKHYRPGKPYGNDLTILIEIMGLWVHMKNDAVLILDHKDPTIYPFFNGTLVLLEPGWNFVGYPSVTTTYIKDVLAGVPYDMVQTYDAVAGRWLSYNGSSDITLGNIVWEMTGLDEPYDAERLANGNTLITDTGKNRVVEVDSSGNIIWDYDGLDDPIDAERLANGNTLIAEFGSIITPGGVIEIDNADNIVWQYTDSYSPMDIERLANGNTLITEIGKFSSSGRVIEVDNAGNIVWEYVGLDYPIDAERLANDNTLIAEIGNDRVIEVNNAGNIVWEYGGLDDPIDVERLANGNTLIAELYRVIEVNSAGNMICEMSGLNDCIDAEILSNGNTLITEISQNRVIEFDSSSILTKMEMGKGYWIHCTASHLWQVDYV